MFLKERLVERTKDSCAGAFVATRSAPEYQVSTVRRDSMVLADEPGAFSRRDPVLASQESIRRGEGVVLVRALSWARFSAR